MKRKYLEKKISEISTDTEINMLEDRKLKNGLADTKRRCTILEKEKIEMEKRIEKLEEIVFALKSNVKEEKKNRSIEKKRKWLTGYPDETESKDV